MYTLRETIELAEGVVAEKGENYVYHEAFPEHVQNAAEGGSTCFYRVDGHVNPNGSYEESTGGPACIVGCILDKVGLLHLAGEGQGVMMFASDHFENDAIEFLNCIQGDQDTGYSWGAALRGAKATYEVPA